MELKGYNSAVKKLENLDKKMRGKIIRKSLRDGAKIVATAMIAEAPRRSGLLASAIKVRAGKSKGKGTISVIAGATKKAFGGAKVFYASFVEWGHRIGKGSATVAPNPFMARGKDKSKDTARSKVIETLRDETQQAAKE